MPGISGLDVARDLAGVHVVFVTAYDQYAVEAFDRAAVDYLLKPVTDDRLAATVARLKDRLASQVGRGSPAPDLARALALLREHLPGLAAASAGGERLAWIRAAVGQQVRLIAVERRLLLRGERQVHERVHRRRRGADPHAAEGPPGAARPGPVLADPSRHDRQSRPRGHDDARPRRTRQGEAQDAAGDARRQPRLRAPLSADVIAARGPGGRHELRPRAARTTMTGHPQPPPTMATTPHDARSLRTASPRGASPRDDGARCGLRSP